eukprot:25315-Hanusia_phi.AAC.1
MFPNKCAPFGTIHSGNSSNVFPTILRPAITREGIAHQLMDVNIRIKDSKIHKNYPFCSLVIEGQIFGRLDISQGD